MFNIISCKDFSSGLRDNTLIYLNPEYEEQVNMALDQI